MKLFEAVKTEISALEAGQRYGLDPDYHGFCRCCFHSERTASMKLYSGKAGDQHTGFYCFGCHAHGSVIDLAAQVLQVEPKDAAATLAADFGIQYDDGCEDLQINWKAAKEAQRKKDLQELLEKKIKKYRGIVLDLFRELENWLRSADPDSEEYYQTVLDRDELDEVTDIFLFGDYENIVKIVIRGETELKEYERKLESIRRCALGRSRESTVSRG